METAAPPPAPSNPNFTATTQRCLESAAAVSLIAISAPTPQRAPTAASATLQQVDYAHWTAWLWQTAPPASTTSPATPLSASPAKQDTLYLETLACTLAEMAFECLPKAATMATSTQLTGARPPARSSPLSTAPTTTQPTEPVSALIASVSARSAVTLQPAAPATLVTPTT